MRIHLIAWSLFLFFNINIQAQIISSLTKLSQALTALKQTLQKPEPKQGTLFDKAINVLTTFSLNKDPKSINAFIIALESTPILNMIPLQERGTFIKAGSRLLQSFDKLLTNNAIELSDQQKANLHIIAQQRNFTIPKNMQISAPPKKQEPQILYQQGNIKQYHVLQQRRPADCGYHALKNGVAMINAIHNNISPAQDIMSFDYYEHMFNIWESKVRKERQALLKKKQLDITNLEYEIKNLKQNKPEDWQEQIKNKNKALEYRNQDLSSNRQWLQSYDWLQGNELTTLISSSINQYLKNIKNPKNYFTVIDNIDWLRPEMNYQGMPEAMIPFIKQFRKSQNIYHAFLLSFSKEYATQQGIPRGTQSHWIAVVAHKKGGKTNYIILDSGNSNRTQSKYIQLLKQIIEKSNIATIKIATSEINNDIDTLTRYLGVLKGTVELRARKEEVITSIIERAQKIIREARKQKIFNTDAFRQYKQTILNVLNDSAFTSIVPQNIQSTIDKIKKELQ